jgi:alpha-galactosidase
MDEPEKRGGWANVNGRDDVVRELRPHMAESGVVTQGELDLAGRWWRETAPGDRGGDQQDGWLDGWLGTCLPFSFQYGGEDGRELLQRLVPQESSSVSGEGTTSHEFQWQDHDTGLLVSWTVRRFQNYPAVEWVLEFANEGSRDTALVEYVEALDLWLDQPEQGQQYTVHGAEGGRSKPDDMIPFSLRMPGIPFWRRLELGGDHPSSNRHLPFFNIETPQDRGVMVGIGWSGKWMARIEPDGTQLHACAGLEQSRFVLHPGERVRTPRILVLFWQGQRLHGHNMWRQLLYEHYVPRLRGELQKPLVSVNVAFTYHGDGGYLHQATEEPVLAVVDPFIELGAELFIIDAGWYEGEPWHDWMGNWRYSPDKFPRGFRPISERLSAAGVDFGIWFASEIVTPRAPVIWEHPEWIQWCEPRQYAALRTAVPEAREWFLAQVDDLVENEGMTCYRQDGSGCYGEEPDHRKGVSESQHIAGLYEQWDTMLERHPELIMEGCSGGGRRVDLETVARFHWHQKSDRWFDVESDQCSLYGANLFLPGGLINIPTQGTDDYTAWSTFAGQFLLAWHPLDEDFPMEQARLQVERFKRVRHLLCGDFYPLTACSLDQEWIGYQFHRVDLDEGLIQLFRRYGEGGVPFRTGDVFVARLRGLDPEKDYQVAFETTGQERLLTGADLAGGFDVTIRLAPGAEMVTYRGA